LMIEWPLGHGGARKGAGRKRKGRRVRVSHKGRPELTGAQPVHVTCRVIQGVGSLRNPVTARLVMEWLARMCEREGFRLVEYSIQGNHLHLLCEADDREALTRAMQVLLSVLARRLNRHWGRRGQVFEDRYHAEVITTPTQCRNALLYVLHNARKHGSRRTCPDPFSTAPWFDFTDRPNTRLDRKPAAIPTSWLMRCGWRRGGSLTVGAHPRLARPPASPVPA
jgi:REP-associated tyrosine transposase